MRVCRALIVLVALTALAGCGTSPDKTDGAPKKDDKSTLPAENAGTVKADALGEAHCTLEADGAWHATGTVKNTTTKKLSFDVRIHIGPANGSPGPAFVQRVDDVKPGKEAPWSVPNVTAQDPAGPCQIQVAIAN